MNKVNIQALMEALPVLEMEPQWLAHIGGLIETSEESSWQEIITLLEPPAGQRVPFIEPVKALATLWRRQGVMPDEAQARALEAVARMKGDVAADRWVTFFDTFEPESPECLPVRDFVAWLRNERRRLDSSGTDLKPDAQGSNERAGNDLLVPPEIADFFEQASEVAASTPMFPKPDNWDEAWSLENRPVLPLPKAMIEFVPGPPWDDIDEWGDWKVTDNPFQRWREAIRPVALELEQALGESVYHFADLNSDIDDDDVHRFLVLHWCCTHKPESAFVRYLLKVSGAGNVAELKAALIDPASYTQPFEMNCSFFRPEAVSCRIDYLPPGVHKTVAVVFLTPEAREVAQSLLAQKIGAHASIIAPEALATHEWVQRATHYCRSWTVRYLDAGALDQPIEILALADELCVVANEKTPGSGFELKLSEGAENLLWLAFDLGIKAAYFYVDRLQLGNPEVSLKKRGVPERVAAHRAQRAAFTRQLQEIRLDNDFGSSGLWGHDGKMLGYDLLDLPFPLVRRIAAWQRDYDDTLNPPEEMGDDTWWTNHNQEAIDIARELQAALGPGVAVKLYRPEGWLTVNQIVAAEAEP